ncbi:hypothetical protein [Halopelagius longus]|uniref:Uncharacterized protein n=1 Tax=Halopelagius longus TaxID=1236180 RepID=A0A1H0XN40_9EURY|nr:hypothetical protein [Halopelagius longus]RDI71946.1 hypothetical protein DWB78_09555 [Halopelagius longus]SDQ04348.1 hypothetical protein SAMN05216278_0015 [Halopelagius longus]
MPSTNDIERPSEALAVTRRYLRRERPLSALVAVLAVAVFLGTYLTASFLPAVVVAAASVVVARAPILQSQGTIRLRTEADPETVRDEFAGPTPPILALQWGVADDVNARDDAVTYPTSYLFGLRSADVTVRTETETTPEGNYRVESEVTMNDRQWATYVSTIRSDGDRTLVDVEYAAHRRFGLRRVPQQFVARRYRDDALAVQGYAVVERDSHFGL